MHKNINNKIKKNTRKQFHSLWEYSNLQVPFPVGSNVRTRPGRARSSTLDESHQGSPPTLSNGVDFGNGDSSISLGKDSD